MSKKAKLAFDLATAAKAIVDSLVKLQGQDGIKAVLNEALADAYQNKVGWKELNSALKDATLILGITEGSLKNLFTTLRWCYKEAVKFDQHNVGRAKALAEKGLAFDLLTGEAKTVKEKGKAKKAKPETQATLNHCGHGLIQAMEQAGFVAFLNSLISMIWESGVDSSTLDDMKMDLVRDALIANGYAKEEEGKIVATVITKDEDEGE
jgi:hypothetical protein